MAKLKKFVIDTDAIVTELKKIFVDQQVNIPKSWRKDSLIVVKQEVNFYAKERIDDVKFNNLLELFDTLLAYLPENGGNVLDEVRNLLVLYALHRAGGISQDAGKLLGISPRMMSYYLKELGLKDAVKEIKRSLVFDGSLDEEIQK